MERKVPRWESELWSYISKGNGQHCPIYNRCQIRLKSGLCADDNREILEKIFSEDSFRAEEYSSLGDMSHNGVSGVGKRVEMLAQKYLEKGNFHRTPVPVELALLSDEQHVVDVREVPLKNHSGALWRLNDEWIIYINSNDSFARQRFTLFHEAFHILAHIATPNPVFSKKGLERGSFNELLADFFASYILMPAELVKERWAEVKDLDRMAGLFIVPKSAMWLRLKLLGLL